MTPEREESRDEDDDGEPDVPRPALRDLAPQAQQPVRGPGPAEPTHEQQ